MTPAVAAVARAGVEEWTTVLADEVARRLALLVEDAASPATDPALKAVVITHAEVRGLLAGRTTNAARFTPGSLRQHVEETAGAAPLFGLQRRFGLNEVEIDCVLVCLAAAIEPRFERAFAYLNDALHARLPGADLLRRLVAPGQIACAALLGPDARLQRYQLLVPIDDGRLGPFRLSDGIVRHVLGLDGFDPMLTRAWCADDAAPLATALWSASPDLERLTSLIDDHASAGLDVPLVLTLRGRAGSGRRYLFEQACRGAGLECIALDARKASAADALLPTLTAALRDAAVVDAGVLIHHCDGWLQDRARLTEIQGHLQPLVKELGGVLAFGSEGDLDVSAWFPSVRVVDVDVAVPGPDARIAAWHVVLGELASMPDAAADDIASALGAKFRLTPGEIARAGHRASGVAEPPATASGWSDLLHQSAAAVATPHLGHLAQAVPPMHTLDHLVLPPDRMAGLEEIVRRVRHRTTVLHEWGLDEVSTRGRGLIALFHGPSGTGKTMAAEAVANALRMQLYRVDLAGVVSKYIGETEKNLRAIFEEAERADAVLFFDEADALFGKRSDVHDAHDRYANIEINYLLQRIESFDGIAILATNMRGHIDEAFLRRIHVTVDFPVPQEAERRGLWHRSFPQRAPVDADVDWSFLARRFELTGGVIRNAALGAAFLAADGSGVIGMPEIVTALHGELVKAGRRVSVDEFGPHAHHLRVSSAAWPAGDR